MSLADVAGRLGYPGTLSGVSVAAKGPSGRALLVALKGNAGTRTVSGLTFADNLGLGSNLITLSGASAATAPGPPPPPTSGQALPSNAAALAAAARAGGKATLGSAPLGTLPGVAVPGPGLTGATALGGGGTTPGTLAAGPLSSVPGSSDRRLPVVWSTLTLLILVAAGEASLAAYRRVSLVPALRRSGTALARAGHHLPYPGRRRRRRRRSGQ